MHIRKLQNLPKLSLHVNINKYIEISFFPLDNKKSLVTFWESKKALVYLLVKICTSEYKFTLFGTSWKTKDKLFLTL